MRKQLIIWTLMLGCLSYLLTGVEPPRLLKMQMPADPAKAKNSLLVSASDLDKIIAALETAELSANVQLTDLKGDIYAELGTVKRGKTKWTPKSAGDEFLIVAFGATGYQTLAAKVSEQPVRPGFQIALIEPRTQVIQKSVEVTFSEFPDLAVTVTYPVNVKPGDELKAGTSVKLENKGVVAARDVVVELVLSGDTKIPVKSAPQGENYQDDILLTGGQATVPVLEPGQVVEISFPGQLKIPADTEPGKYYLGAVADPAGQIKELDEENNVESGFILIAGTEPKAFILDLADAQIYFEPANYTFNLVTQGVPLSDGHDWKLCRMKPHDYHFQHLSWQDFYWEVDSYEPLVWEIRGGQFCKPGGKEKVLPIKTDVQGGSLLILPKNFTMKLPKTVLRYEPGLKAFSILCYNQRIDHAPYWRICKVASHLYQIKHILWPDFFLEVNTFRKTVVKVTGAELCKSGGKAEPLAIKVAVEE